MPKSRIKSRHLDGLNDHRIIRDRLEWEGFSEANIPADGNSDELFKISDYHKQVRQELVKQAAAAADVFWAKVVVIASFRDNSSIELLPKSQKFDKVIYLSFRAQVQIQIQLRWRYIGRIRRIRRRTRGRHTGVSEITSTILLLIQTLIKEFDDRVVSNNVGP
ncbi:hypothetical protein OROHE_014500 [Orobanche hederae]